MADEIKVKLMDNDMYRKLIATIIGIRSSQEQDIEKCITVWTPNTVYEKGHCVLYRENQSKYYGSYIAKATHNSGEVFNETYWECVDSTEFESYSTEELEAMLNLSTEELQNLQSLIHDDEISTNYTHSSSKIYSSIQDAIDVAKTYTNSQLGKAVKPAYLEVSSTSEMTDAHYIYLLSNGTSFDMYILENGTTPKKIGTSDIDLSGYVQTTTLESDYSTTAENDGKYATITQVEVKADKSLIVTPSSTSTTNQIANAKDTYNLATRKPIAIDNTVDILTLNRGYYAFEGDVPTDKNYPQELCGTYRYITIEVGGYIGVSNGYRRLTLKDSYDNTIFIRHQSWDSWVSWGKICTTKVADVGKTLITISDETNYKNSENSESFYVVKNGTCFVTLCIDCVSPSSNIEIGNLPPTYGIFRFSMSRATVSMDGYVLPTGKLKVSGGSAGSTYFVVSFSYPVAES